MQQVMMPKQSFDQLVEQLNTGWPIIEGRELLDTIDTQNGRFELLGAHFAGHTKRVYAILYDNVRLKNIVGELKPLAVDLAKGIS